MSSHDTALEQNEYKLVLVKSGSNTIWAERRGEGLCLPRIAIRRWMRQADQLQQAIEDAWSIRTIILDVLPTARGSVPCAVAEIISSGSPDGFAAASIDDISNSEIISEERCVICDILAGNPGCRGPFSRVGWLEEAKVWLYTVVGKKPEFTREICQFNASGNFALMSFGGRRSHPAYWLKATGEPNEREFTVTTMLSKQFPRHLPPLVAAREDWNAWITEDAGRPLRDSFTLPALKQATTALAELQIQSIEHIEKLLHAGCFDQRITILKANLYRLMDYLEEAMENQTSTKVPRLERYRLHEIGRILESACVRLLELQIPDGLIHNDMNSSNILFDGSQCVLTDWAEGYIGNPFLSFQQILNQVARNELSRGWCRTLEVLYEEQWRAILTESQIESAFALMPLLAIASYLYERGTWLTSSRRADLHFQSYSRSLARSMDRAARAPELLEALCQ